MATATNAMERGKPPSEFLALIPSETSIQLQEEVRSKLVKVERDAKEAVRVAAEQAAAFPGGLMAQILPSGKRLYGEQVTKPVEQEPPAIHFAL